MFISPNCTPLFTARKRSLRRLCFYTCLSVILFTGGGVVCMARGVCLCVRRACMAEGHVWAGGHAWWGVCVAEGYAWWGACMAGLCSWHGGGHAWCGGGVHGRGCAWWGACMAGGVHDGGHACHTHPPDTTRYGRSMRGRYASYWNAFFLTCNFPCF